MDGVSRLRAGYWAALTLGQEPRGTTMQSSAGETTHRTTQRNLVGADLMATADTLWIERGAGNPQRVVPGQACDEFVAQLEGRGLQLVAWPADTDVTPEIANQVLQSADPIYYARHQDRS